MLPKIIAAILALLTFLPCAQPAARRFQVDRQHHAHINSQNSAGIAGSKQHSSQTGVKKDGHSDQQGESKIEMVTMAHDQHAHTRVDELPDTAVSSQFFVASSTLVTPVSGPNPGGNSESLVMVPGSHQGGNLQKMTSILNSPVSGPNPGGNSESLVMVSGSHPGGNLQKMASMLNTPVSGPNPGGNLESLVEASGSNPSGNLPKEGSMSDIPVSGPKLGGHVESLLMVPGSRPGGDLQKMASILNTPVSGPNPGGNSENLVMVPGGNLQKMASMLNTPVSGPSPGGNSESLIMVPGSNPGGNLRKVASMMSIPVARPNPGGNSGLLAASPVSKPGSNVLTVPASSNPAGGGTAQVLAGSSSGPNPGGNSQILMAMDRRIVENPNAEDLAASSSPNTGHVRSLAAAENGHMEQAFSLHEKAIHGPSNNPNRDRKDTILDCDEIHRKSESREEERMPFHLQDEELLLNSMTRMGVAVPQH